MNTFRIIYALFQEIEKKKRVYLLIFLNIIAGFVEVLSIGAIIPFISVMANPTMIRSNKVYQSIASTFHFGEVTDGRLITIFSLLFFGAIFIATLFKLFLMKYNHRLMYDIATRFNNKLYENILRRPFHEHSSMNSGAVISKLTTKVSTLSGVLNSIILIIGNLISSIFLMSLLLAYEAKIIFMFIGVLVLIYLVLSKGFKKKLAKNSEVIAYEQGHVVKIVQDGLGAIRDVIIANNHSFYVNLFSKSTKRLNNTLASNYFIGHSPKVVLEFFAMLFIGVITIWYQRSEQGLVAALPIMGVIALSAQRLLPAIQTVYQNWSSIKSSDNTVLELLEILKLKQEEVPDTSNGHMFIEKVSFKDLSFSFSSTGREILRRVNLEIPINSHVAFVGKTGSGKSTAVDIVMGLLLPTKGQVLIDGIPLAPGNIRNWQSQISHVPQEIFITDGSLAENIAFGIPESEYDLKRMTEVINKAGLSDFVDDSEKGLTTHVGERGGKMSGGQRQRLGIARALYKGSKVLIFDEATSALDSETENKILETISNLSSDITIITIAHRLSTIEKCDAVFEIKDAEVNRYSSFSDFMQAASKKNVSLG